MVALAAPRAPLASTRRASVVFAREWAREPVVERLISLGRSLTDAARARGARGATGASDPRPPLLLTQDEPVLWVSAARAALEPWYRLSLPSESAVELLMNKSAFHDLALREGWPAPATWRIESRAELDAHLGNIVLPCILKPRTKNAAFRLHAPRKAFIASSRDGLARAYDLVAQWEKEVLVQELIGGGDDRIAFCLGYRGPATGSLALFAGRKLVQFPVGCGNTALSVPAPDAWRAAIESLTRRIWERTGCVGLGSVEFKMRPGSDEPVLMEPTVGRTNYQNEVAVLNGVNLPAIAYCDLLGLPRPEGAPPRRPVALADGPALYRAARERGASRGAAARAWLASGPGGRRDMIARADDPLPLVASALGALGGWARGALGAALRAALGSRVAALLGPRVSKRLRTSRKSRVDVRRDRR